MKLNPKSATNTSNFKAFLNCILYIFCFECLEDLSIDRGRHQNNPERRIPNTGSMKELNSSNLLAMASNLIALTANLLAV